jgi:tubulin monoglycylase TTLL3/8
MLSHTICKLYFQDLYESAKRVLTDVRKFWPQIDLDGMNNIWIVKPGAQSRGRGIQLTDKLDRVIEKVNPTALKESRYVVQKYIG